MTEQSIDGHPYAFEVKGKYLPTFGQTTRRGTLVIPGGGCIHWRANKGDVCPFCAFPPFSRETNLGPDHNGTFGPWTLTTDIYERMYKSALADSEPIESLAIFNGGSFFPSAELPTAFQEFVYKDVASRSSLRQLMVEGHPNFVSERTLVKAKSQLSDTDFMVGMGLESANDFVRNMLLKKGIDRKVFENKIQLMQKHGVQIFVYVFLKAPGLTEAESKADVLATMKYLSDLGVDEMALSCAFVPPGSPIETLYNEGRFSPPRLSTILEIIAEAKTHGWPLTIGGFDDFPPPVAIPSNCPDCDPRIILALDHLRETGDLPKIPQQTCNC